MNFDELSLNIDLVIKTSEGRAVLQAIFNTLNLDVPLYTTDANTALAFSAKRDLMLKILDLFTDEQLIKIRGNTTCQKHLIRLNNLQ